MPSLPNVKNGSKVFRSCRSPATKKANLPKFGFTLTSRRKRVGLTKLSLNNAGFRRRIVQLAWRALICSFALFFSTLQNFSADLPQGYTRFCARCGLKDVDTFVSQSEQFV